MITNISKRLTTVALATAGSVAAFGFAGAAQAATFANGTFGGPTMPNGVTFTGNLAAASSITFGSLAGLVANVPSTYTPLGGLTNPNDFMPGIGPSGATFDVMAYFTAEFTGTPTNVLNLAGGTTNGITLVFASTTTPPDRYTFTAVSGTVVDQTDTGLNVSFLGTFTDAGGTYMPAPASVSISIAATGVGQGTNTFIFGTPPDGKVPEPSAVLGILAVAGIGAFARRKS